MSISFTCTTCGAALKAPDAYAGGRARCASCGASVRIPRTHDGTSGPSSPRSTPARKDPLPSTHASPGGSASARRSPGKRLRNSALVVGIVLVLTGLLAVLWPHGAPPNAGESIVSPEAGPSDTPALPEASLYPPRYYTWRTLPGPMGAKPVRYYGIMDRSGKEIVPYKFRKPVFFSEGLAALEHGFGSYGYIDVDGNWAIPPKFKVEKHSIPESFREGRASFDGPRGEGFIDRTGAIVIEPQWFVISGFAEGLALVAGDEEGICYIDPQGVPVLRFPPDTTPLGVGSLDVLGRFSDGLVPVQEGPASFGYMNRAGQVVMRIPDAENVRGFSEGLAAVRVHGKWGYVNRNGEFVIAPTYDAARDFSEGVAAVSIDDRWGYIKKDGAVLVTPQYDWASEFSEGCGVVSAGDRYGFVDSKGHELTMACVLALPFDAGLALCSPYGWFDHSGRFVWVSPDVTDRKIESLDDLAGDPLGGLPKPNPRPPLFTRENHPADNEK